MPVMIPGSAIGRISRNDTDSRPKKRKRAIANAAAEPSRIAIAVVIGADLQRQLERRPRLLVVPGDAEPVQRPARDGPALDVRAVERVHRDDHERDPEERDHERRPRNQVRSGSRVSPSERLERAEPARDREVDAHDDHRDHRERRRERDVRVDADEAVDDVPDEARARPADEQRRDVVAEREREREDRAGDERPAARAAG